MGFRLKAGPSAEKSMLGKKSFVFAAILAGGLVTFDASDVSACGTCRLSRGPDLVLIGGLTIPGQVGAYPFHSGVSFEDTFDAMTISLTDRRIDLSMDLSIDSIVGIETGPNSGNSSPADETARKLNALGNDAMLYAIHDDHLDFALLDGDHVDFLRAAFSGTGIEGLQDAQFNIASLLDSDYRLIKVDQIGFDEAGAGLAPEPTSVAFLCLGLLAIVRRRKR